MMLQGRPISKQVEPRVSSRAEPPEEQTIVKYQHDIKPCSGHGVIYDQDCRCPATPIQIYSVLAAACHMLPATGPALEPNTTG